MFADPAEKPGPAVDRLQSARLTIRTGDDGMPLVKLGDMELSGLLSAEGFRIETDYDAGPGHWRIFMQFGAGPLGALDLDIDVETARTLLDHAAARAANGE